MYFKEIALAGLLHDIGKFYQKAKQSPINNKGKHPKVSKEFIKTYFNFFNKYVDANILMEFVARHHENKMYFDEEFLAGYGDENIKNYTYIVATADNLSSKERDESQLGTADFRIRPLNCVFNRVNISNNSSKVLSYKSGEYNVDNIVPQDILENEYSSTDKLIGDFTNQMDLLIKNPPQNFNALMIVLDRILKKYLWCIPASSQDIISDISLYDHSKTTSAISSALYLYQQNIEKINRNNINDNKYKYILIGFSFSDIQNYLIGIYDTNKKGINKKFRTRAFLVDIITEAIAKELLEQFDLPIQNKLFSIGGKCFILLPNINDYIIKFQNIMKNITSDLYDRYKGDICINYDYIEMNKDSFGNYSDVLLELTKKLNSKEFKPFEDIFIESDSWNLEKFILYNDLDNKKICNQCNKRIIEKTKSICDECNQQIDIGTILPKAKYVIFKKGIGYNLFLDNTINVVEKIEYNDFDYAIQLDDFEYVENINLPIEIKHIANYVPLDENNNTLNFDDIALKSLGSNKLALIKVDVNNLSYLLKEGLKKDNNNYATISRVETLSRMIDTFFKVCVKKLLKEKFKNTYCVYSGGDYLILITPFSDTVVLSREIMKSFNEYVGKNNDFNLAFSIIDFSPKTHISLILNECDRQLNRIKSLKNSNRVYFMGEYLLEKDFIILFLGEARLILKEINKIDINILRRLSQYSDMYRKFIKENDVNQLMFVPLLERDIERNYSNIKDTNFYKNVKEMLENASSDYKNKNKNLKLYYMNKVIKYILLLTKEERKNGI